MRLPCSLLLAVVVAACGGDQAASCKGSYLTYDNFGAPFMTSWCRGCHGVDVPPGMRQHAPAGDNFDSLDEIRADAIAIELDVTKQTMPPAGGPSDAEREMLIEWLQCGAQ